MEELTKRNGKGIWLREIERGMKRFDASLEWQCENLLHDEEIEKIRVDDQMEGQMKSQMLRAKRLKSIEEVLEVEVLVHTHFFNEFSGTKSSQFLKRLSCARAQLRCSSSRRPGGQSTAARMG